MMAAPVALVIVATVVEVWMASISKSFLPDKFLADRFSGDHAILDLSRAQAMKSSSFRSLDPSVLEFCLVSSQHKILFILEILDSSTAIFCCSLISVRQRQGLFNHTVG